MNSRFSGAGGCLANAGRFAYLAAMAIRPILIHPDPRLRKAAARVEAVDEGVRALAADMLATMYEAPGIGLAATQLGVMKQVFVMDCAGKEEPARPMVLINPEIVKRSDEMAVNEEGCLSVPQIYDRVERHERVTVRALNRDGEAFEVDAEGLASVCVQHEMDHLLGKVFVEYLSPLKRNRIRTKMLKKTRDEQK